MPVSQCPVCQLRFWARTEVEHHVREEHGGGRLPDGSPPIPRQASAVAVPRVRAGVDADQLAAAPVLAELPRMRSWPSDEAPARATAPAARIAEEAQSS